MEQLKPENNGNKRTRIESGLDSVSDSPESKRVNSDRVGAGLGFDSNRPGESDVVEAEVDSDAPEVKLIREDLLDILDEPDAPTDCSPEIQDLDSVMKSFEEEILHGSELTDFQTVFDLTTSDSGDQPDFGYLLEASDDDLGLPPTVSPVNEQVNGESHVMPENTADFGNTVGFEDEMPNYDTFDFGMVGEGDNIGGNGDGNGNGDFVSVDGLFDYPEPLDFGEFSWRQESLPAL